MTAIAPKIADLRIGTKIAGAIGILFLAIALTGGFALRGIGQVYAAAQKPQVDGFLDSVRAA